MKTLLKWLAPVTFENSTRRFEFLMAILRFAAYRVLHEDIDLPCCDEQEGSTTANDNYFHERLYEIQEEDAVRSFPGQVFFAALTVIDAIRLNQICGRKQAAVVRKPIS